MEASTLERINLLPRAQAISVGDSVFNEEQRRFIAEVYKSLLGKDIKNCSCRHRYSDALEEICFTLKIKTKMNRKYLLKAGMLIWIGTDCYSNYNLTDEVAEKYLAMHPEAREKEFQRWPDENEEQEKPKPEEPTQAPEPKDGEGEGHEPAPETTDEGEGKEPDLEPTPEPEPEAKPKAKKGK